MVCEPALTSELSYTRVYSSYAINQIVKKPLHRFFFIHSFFLHIISVVLQQNRNFPRAFFLQNDQVYYTHKVDIVWKKKKKHYQS